MPDFDAVATAIAARFAPAQVTPPAGLVNIRKSTADLPQGLGQMPVVLVFPDHGAFAAGGGTRVGPQTFLVRFYFGLTRNLARETNACRKWLTVLVDQLRLSTQLGGTVTAARVIAWRVGVLPYGRAGRSYSGVELTVEVITTESWLPVS